VFSEAAERSALGIAHTVNEPTNFQRSIFDLETATELLAVLSLALTSAANASSKGGSVHCLGTPTTTSMALQTWTLPLPYPPHGGGHVHRRCQCAESSAVCCVRQPTRLPFSIATPLKRDTAKLGHRAGRRLVRKLQRCVPWLDDGTLALSNVPGARASPPSAPAYSGGRGLSAIFGPPLEKVLFRR
jgi:hypothetical protein